MPTDSAKFNSMINYLNTKIRENVEKDSALRDIVSNHILHFRAFPSKGWIYNGNALLKEINAFFDSRIFESAETRSYHPIGSQYPLLTKINAKYWFAPVKYRTTPFFQLDAHAYALEDSDSTVIARIRDKVAKAHTYKGSPLWLVLYISDHQTIAVDNLHSIKNHALSFGPFEKLFVGEDWYSLCYAVTI